jgi:ubiquinone/menaquinone biosynthesis C-methylase UbiE
MDYDAYDIAVIYDRARALLLPATARLWQELVADYIDPGATPLTLDLGCGTGRFSGLVAAVRRPGHRDRPVGKDGATGPPQTEPRNISY